MSAVCCVPQALELRPTPPTSIAFHCQRTSRAALASVPMPVPAPTITERWSSLSGCFLCFANNDDDDDNDECIKL